MMPAWLKRFWAWLLGWFLGRGPVFRSEHVADAPDRLAKNVVYIIGEDGYDWSGGDDLPRRLR